MTLTAPFPIPPLLGSMADAMEEIRQMLLSYEEAMVDAPRTPENRRAAQDFDLAVQILQDLEHISQKLAAELPPDLMAHHSLPLAGLRLERSRRRFVAAARGAPAPDTPPVPQIDLFSTDPAPAKTAPATGGSAR
ncbi:hypothetical protein [Pararhodobacter sp. CCB-MM2]|uniref:hypothetical protein n=1 Tax=Pararhodobacter sp. CCB-MM2 TaxID=1786003 RepID=UPI0008369515|nr:hypothetical protein [Pararhodobacter sp. CCB-MM2]MCA2014020.1 hypothetical protein [Cereibacter sphaeroides]